MRLPGLSPSSKTSYERRLATALSAVQRPPFRSGYLAAGLLSALGSKKRQPHHYRLLGLQQGCSMEEVRRTYKKYALLLHPDKAMAACHFATRLPLPGNGCGGGGNGSNGTGAASTELLGLADNVRLRLEAGASWLFKAAQEAADALQDQGVSNRKAAMMSVRCRLILLTL